MFLRWIDLGGDFTATGLGLAWDSNHWLFLVPISGALLVGAASTRSPYTRIAAVFAGLGGAGVMLGGVSARRTAWRVAGGIAVLVGFFAPWADDSLFKTLTSDYIGMMPFSVRVLWLIPLAGLGGIVAAGGKDGGKVALACGIAVY